jgi:acyl-coenzyme A synthetase/AMP-(fatty) acid ligase
MTAEPSGPIWTCDPVTAAEAAVTRFAAEAGARAGHDLSGYRDLLAWSVRDLGAFWGAVADFFGLGLGDGPVLADPRMPGATWFPAARVNYAELALRHGLGPALAGTVAVTSVGEDGATATLTWAQLRAAVGAFAGTLRDLGVRPGDRVTGYLPNVAETLIAFLASASIGAVWSACAQDYAAAGAAARFAQLAPVVLVAADGYRWNGRAVDRRTEVTELQRLLPTLRATVHVRNLGLDGPATGSGFGGVNLAWDDAVARYRDAYFAAWPGVWRHGDWAEVTGRGSVIVTGRSDATLNRNGVRLGSADIYTAIETMPEIRDSLVIGAELGDGGYWLALFVVLAEGAALTGELTEAVNKRIRAQASPRHVPDDVIAVPSLPHTRTGKRLEVPVKRLIQGHPLAGVASADAVDDFAALAQFTAYSRRPARPAGKDAEGSAR